MRKLPHKYFVTQPTLLVHLWPSVALRDGSAANYWSVFAFEHLISVKLMKYFPNSIKTLSIRFAELDTCYVTVRLNRSALSLGKSGNSSYFVIPRYFNDCWIYMYFCRKFSPAVSTLLVCWRKLSTICESDSQGQGKSSNNFNLRFYTFYDTQDLPN